MPAKISPITMKSKGAHRSLGHFELVNSFSSFNDISNPGVAQNVALQFAEAVERALVADHYVLIGGIPIVFGAFLQEPVAAVAAISLNALLTLIFVVFLPIIFCHWAFFRVVQIFPANVAALSTLCIPAIGVFSSALLLGEPLRFYELAALGLVVVSLGLTGLSKRSAR